MPDTLQTLADGFDSLEGGMDGGLAPSIIGKNQTALSVNMSHRGGFIGPRPYFVGHVLDYDNDDQVEADFNTLPFQVAKAFYPDVGDPLIMVLIGGHLFSINPSNGFTVADISPGTILNPSILHDGWMEQVERWMVVNDGQTLPMISDGASTRYADPDEIKPGTAMAYCNGRLWYARPDRQSFRATDLVYGAGSRSDVLKETENTFLNGGGDFVVPTSSGSITAMSVPAVLDTSLGQGPLQVFTSRGVFSVNTPILREEWLKVTYPIQTVSMIGNGATGQQSTVTQNGDIFYRSQDGIRSYVLARREFGDWANMPIDREVSEHITDAEALLYKGSAVIHDDRLLMTTGAGYRDLGVFFNGLAALDFDLGSGLRVKLPASWEGIWTGIKIHQILTITIGKVERCFMFVRNDSNVLRLYEIMPRGYSDQEFELPTSTTRVEWATETATLKWGLPNQLKMLNGGRMDVRNMRGRVVFTMQYRPDGYPGWIDWQEWTVDCDNLDTCTPDCALRTPNPGYSNRFILKKPEPSCITTAHLASNVAYEFQFKLKVSGHCEIRKMMFYAMQVPEPMTPPNCDLGECGNPDSCPGDIYTYSLVI